jgi:hypothetical protein
MSGVWNSTSYPERRRIQRGPALRFVMTAVSASVVASPFLPNPPSPPCTPVERPPSHVQRVFQVCDRRASSEGTRRDTDTPCSCSSRARLVIMPGPLEHRAYRTCHGLVADARCQRRAVVGSPVRGRSPSLPVYEGGGPRPVAKCRSPADVWHPRYDRCTGARGIRAAMWRYPRRRRHPATSGRDHPARRCRAW